MAQLKNDALQRKETLKNIIRDLHDGVDVEEIKERFGDLLDQVGAAEIGEIEQELVNEGLAIEEIQKLCDVHVAVFKDSLDKQQATENEITISEDDPVAILKKENIETTNLVNEIKPLVVKIAGFGESTDISKQLGEWRNKHDRLMGLDSHYTKKENILFPYLERHGISGPPSVMWGIHDEIRADLKLINELLKAKTDNKASAILTGTIMDKVIPTLQAISEMIYKEENILFPMCKETFSDDEWAEIKVQLGDPMARVYKEKDLGRVEEGSLPEGIDLEVGVLNPEQINLILTHLPIDITYVDENDEVRYFSLGPERIFERARAVIGRKVQFCHPPASMGIVEQILQDFKSGKKNDADFWIQMGDKLVYIRYFAVRDKDGTYRGTLEVSQNISEIKKITGEKRIYDY